MDNWGAYQSDVDQRILQIVDEIALHIKSNNLRPGDRLLSESELSSSLNISRSSVRESLSQLNDMGLARSVQGKGLILNDVTVGTYFRQFDNPAVKLFMNLSPDDMKNIKEVRLMIERYSIEVFFSSFEQRLLDELREILEQMRRHCKRKDAVTYMEVDLEFHKKIVGFSGNAFLLNIYSVLRMPTLREVEIAFADNNLNTIHMYHEKIFDCLERKDLHVHEVIKNHLEYYVRQSTEGDTHPPLT